MEVFCLKKNQKRVYLQGKRNNSTHRHDEGGKEITYWAKLMVLGRFN